MLVCPECQCKNPELNSFCQQCGTSLTHTSCYECGSSVAWDAERCPTCGASTATLWHAVIFVPDLQSLDQNLISAPNLTTAEENSNLEPDIVKYQEIFESLGFEDFYLDVNHRYHILDCHQINLTHKFLSLTVFDSQPLQESELDATLEEYPELLDSEEQQTEEFAQSIPNLPKIVRFYLNLESSHPAIPQVYDAWQQEDKTIVLLSHLPKGKLLSELWQSSEVSLTQILYIFDEMMNVWQQLVPIGCCQSLLELNNLRIDEDESLFLEQLYLDEIGQQSSLKDLARVWQVWLEDAPNNESQKLLPLLEKINQGQITNIEELHSQLGLIAQQEAFGFDSSFDEDSREDFAADDEAEIVSPLGVNDDIPTIVLPMQLLSLSDAASTDIGLQRDHNEDFFGIVTEIKKEENLAGKLIQARGLYMVCDGMGGHAAGEVASAMAVETLQKYFQEHWLEPELPSEELIRQGILLTNEKLYQVNKDNNSSGSGRMGTTLVLALVQNNKAAIAHVGDSRIYRITRKDGIEQLTLDHEVGQREILRGVDPEIAYARPDAYQLTQALGPRDNSFVSPNIGFLEIHEDTLLLLCSDGLSDNDLLENHGLEYLVPLLSSSASLEQGSLKLIDLANDHNGHDNITVLLVRIKVRPDFQEQSLL